MDIGGLNSASELMDDAEPLRYAMRDSLRRNFSASTSGGGMPRSESRISKEGAVSPSYRTVTLLGLDGEVSSFRTSGLVVRGKV